MIFNKDNFFEEISKYTFEEELIKSSLYLMLEGYEPNHFFIYETHEDGELASIEIVFCNNAVCYEIYLIFDTEDVVYDYDLTYGINIKILEEKF